MMGKVSFIICPCLYSLPQSLALSVLACLHSLEFLEYFMLFHPPTPLLSHSLYLSDPHLPTSTHPIINQMPSWAFPPAKPSQPGPHPSGTSWPLHSPGLHSSVNLALTHHLEYYSFVPMPIFSTRLSCLGVQAILFMSIMPIPDTGSGIKSEVYFIEWERVNEGLGTSASPENKSLKGQK